MATPPVTPTPTDKEGFWKQVSPHLAAAFRALAEVFILLRCHLYILWWGAVSQPLRKFLVSAAFNVAFLGSVVFFAEALGLVIPLHLLSLPAWIGWPSVAASVFLFYIRVMEFRRSHERARFAATLRMILLECTELQAAGGGDRATLDEFVRKAMTALRGVFADRIEVNLNVMWYNEQTRFLNIGPVHPDTAHYEPNLTLERGVGAAGVALNEGVLVYVPHRSFLHGIKVRLVGTYTPDGILALDRYYRLAPNVYVPVSVQPYKSILSVPILTKSGPKGVLNVDSQRWNPFDENDMDTAGCVAGVIGLAVDLST